MRNVTVAWNGGVAVFPLAEDDTRAVEEIVADYLANAQVFVDEEEYHSVKGDRRRLAMLDDDGFVKGVTRCDRCGDESNSPPDLVCGRIEYDAAGFAVTLPCPGKYRRVRVSDL